MKNSRFGLAAALLLGLVFCSQAADVTSTASLRKGSASVSITPAASAPAATVNLDSCEDYVKQSSLAPADYNCRVTVMRTVTKPKPADPPKPTDPALFKQTVQCTAPTVGSFVQTRDYTLVTTATGKVWNPTPWVPLIAPAGACTTPVTSLLPYVDKSKIPLADPKFVYSGPRVQPAPGPFGMGDSQGPSANDIGAFRLICHFSHMSNNDPLVYPNKPDASHLHTFVGNTGVDANSTVSTIANAGNSTCDGGTLNRSAYWFPSMIDTTDGTPIAPLSMLVYYKTGYGGIKPADVKAVPTGLRMISGSAAGTPTSNTSASRYACLGGTDQNWHTYIPACTAGATEMIMEVSFPQCWDGVNLSSPDNKSHMAETTGKGCPSTHPVALPKIDYEIHYAVTTKMAKWRLSSDNYAATSQGGYSGHGDYMMGWDVPTMAKIVKNCENPSIDCHTNLLGDGTWMY